MARLAATSAGDSTMEGNPILAQPNGNLRIQSKRIFWTYPQVLPRDSSNQEQAVAKREIFNMLLTKLSSKNGLFCTHIAVCVEKHEDGGYHFHAITKTSKGYGRCQASEFDYKGHHPNIQTMKGLWWQACEYLLKEDPEPLVGGTKGSWDIKDVVKQGKRKKSTSSKQLVEQLIDMAQTPVQVLRNQEMDYSTRARLLMQWSSINSAWDAVQQAKENENLRVKSATFDLEDLSVETPQVLRNSPASCKVYQAIIQKYHPDVIRPRTFDREHIYLSSTCPGVGKSYLTSVVLPTIVDVATVPCPEMGSSAFWPPVDVEARTFILDEFGLGQVPMQKLKTLLDIHSQRKPLRMRVLGGWMNLCHTPVVWILSNSPLEDIYPGKKMSEREALIHRLPHNIHIDEGDNLFPLIEYLENFQVLEEESSEME